MAEAVGFEPTSPSLDYPISSRGRYDHFDTLPQPQPTRLRGFSIIGKTALFVKGRGEKFTRAFPSPQQKGNSAYFERIPAN